LDFIFLDIVRKITEFVKDKAMVAPPGQIGQVGWKSRKQSKNLLLKQQLKKKNYRLGVWLKW
jgi:hypothetical protein